MHANRYWLLFLSCLVAILIWKSGGALYKLYQYYRLTAKTEAVIDSWSVFKQSEERYFLNAHYHFNVGSQTFSGSTTFANPQFLNAGSAEDTAKKRVTVSTIVWYSARNPHYSTLQKTFPLKECLYAVVLCGLFVYFICLGYYVGSNRSRKQNS